ncbi:MAG: hypothetical protein R3B70_34270 [Polyangiaceae bacterium]
MHWPLAGSQKSLVQVMPSLQSTGVPERQPITGLHASSPSQATPLLQMASMGMWVQVPAPSSQASAVQAIPSSHGREPATQVPATHASLPLQKRPSSH